MAQNECTKNEKTGEVRFILKTCICSENIINKFKRLSHNLIEDKKQGCATNKYKGCPVDAKIFT